jgi:hypothetical protein
MISLVTSVLGLCVATFIIFLIRKDRLRVDHGMGWLLVAAGFALLGLGPSIVDHVAGFLGVAYPPILAITLVIAVLVVKILLMDIERSRIEIHHQRLIQRLAMLEADLENRIKKGS